MNLKEAFRFQNKLLRLMEEAECILSQEHNITQVTNIMLLHKVNPDAQDEATPELPGTDYAEQITQVAELLMFLLGERERLSYAIRAAKQTMPVDFDGEVSLNTRRQSVAGIFRRMAELRATEHVYPGAGVGYKFNAEGNQVTYRCDMKKVTTINYDRHKVRAFAVALSKQADEMSARLDSLTVNTQVGYEAPFDVNESFAQVLSWFTEQAS